MNQNVVLVNTDLVRLDYLYPLRTLEKITPQIPIGLCYIAACLEEHGVPVSIIDNFAEAYSESVLAETILAQNPSIVGFSTTTQNIPQAYAVAKLLKDMDDTIAIVFGGVHATVMPRDVLAHGYVDYVIVGEGEYALLELVQSLESGGKNISEIKGLCRPSFS